MGMRAAVAGASGYAGGELLRLLVAHPELEVGAVIALAVVALVTAIVTIVSVPPAPPPDVPAALD